MNTRVKWYFRLAVLLLIAALAHAAVPSGWTLITSTTTDQTGCTQATTSGICLVQPTTTSLQVWAWANGGAMVEIYPATGTAPTQLGITCPTVSIGTSGLVVPTTSPCTITLLK